MSTAKTLVTPGIFSHIESESNEESMARIVDMMKCQAAKVAEWPKCSKCEDKADPARGGLCGRCVEREEESERLFQRLIRKSRIPGRYEWALFVNAELMGERIKNEAAIDAAAAWNFEDRLVLVGAAGSGKTSLACAVAREYIAAKCRGAVFVDSFELSMARKHSGLGREAELVEQALRASLLVLDDVGSEARDPDATVPHVLFDRHQHSRPTIVTTWATASELTTVYGAGIARRIFDGACIVRLGGK